MLNQNGKLIVTDDVWSLIQSAQRAGNKIVWTSDEDNWGLMENWEFPKEVGRELREDCDGITLFKMNKLMEDGIPAACLHFTVCRTPDGEGHAVLTVSTDKGDYILDSNLDEVATYPSMKKKGYSFLFRSTSGKMTAKWVKIL